jgi:hypothetical protein
MISNTLQNNFTFLFPKGFCPVEIEEKYSKYLNKIHGNYFNNIKDIINYTVQSISLPSVQYDSIEQTGLIGRKREYRSNIPQPDILEKVLKHPALEVKTLDHMIGNDKDDKYIDDKHMNYAHRLLQEKQGQLSLPIKFK